MVDRVRRTMVPEGRARISPAFQRREAPRMAIKSRRDGRHAECAGALNRPFGHIIPVSQDVTDPNSPGFLECSSRWLQVLLLSSSGAWDLVRALGGARFPPVQGIQEHNS